MVSLNWHIICFYNGATTFSIQTLSIITLNINGLFATLSLNDKRHYAECHYAECCILFIAVLNVVMLNVVVLSVMAPLYYIGYTYTENIERTYLFHILHTQIYQINGTL
jgi:hypothetical protein